MRLGGRHLELRRQMRVELPRLHGLGMHEQTPTADLLAQHVSPGDHVLEQPRTDAVAFVTNVDTAAGEKGNRFGGTGWGYRLGVPASSLAGSNGRRHPRTSAAPVSDAPYRHFGDAAGSDTVDRRRMTA